LKAFDRFRALSQVQQIVAIVLLVIVCSAILGAVWFIFLQTPYRPLFSGLKTVDAATIVAELDRKKIPYRLADGGATILVPEDRVDATRLSVMTEEIPLKGTVGFELFNKADLGLTDFAQKINYQRALQGELERTIMSLDGVASARVHISLGEDRLFRDDQVPPKASVTVHMARGTRLDVKTVMGIQRLIAAAVPRLDATNVVVLDEGGQVMSSASVAAVPVSRGAERPDEQNAIEEFYAARVHQVVAPEIRGDVLVRVVASISASQAHDQHGLLIWNPVARDFPLQVTVTSSEMLSADVQNNLRAAVALCIGSITGDVVQFAMAEPSARAPASPMIAPQNPNNHDWVAPSAASGINLTLSEVLFALVPIVLIVCFVAVLRNIRRPKSLSEQQRSALASRLREALQGETNATS
jgi:flagellar M-ring protein FliF